MRYNEIYTITPSLFFDVILIFFPILFRFNVNAFIIVKRYKQYDNKRSVILLYHYNQHFELWMLVFFI